MSGNIQMCRTVQDNVRGKADDLFHFPLHVQHHFDFPVIEEPQPKGAGWLIHSKTLQSYLALLGSSQQEEIQEACSGALRNLTAQEGIVRKIIVLYQRNSLNCNAV